MRPKIPDGLRCVAQRLGSCDSVLAFPPAVRKVIYTTDEMRKRWRRTLPIRYVRASGHRTGALSDLGRDCFHRLNSR